MNRRYAKALRKKIESLANTMPDEEALSVPDLFPRYNPDAHYLTGDRFCYEGKLYKVLQEHHAQPDWTPETAVSLYVEVTPPDVIPVWKQPAGAHDAYAIGAKVHYPTITDPIYENTYDGNVYPPDVYGWKVVEE